MRDDDEGRTWHELPPRVGRIVSRNIAQKDKRCVASFERQNGEICHSSESSGEVHASSVFLSLFVTLRGWPKNKTGSSRLTLLVVGNKGLGDGLADRVDLGDVAATLDTDADVDLVEVVGTEEEDRLDGLLAERRGLEELDRLAVDTDEAAAGLAVGDSDSGLLASENLDGLDLLVRVGHCIGLSASNTGKGRGRAGGGRGTREKGGHRRREEAGTTRFGDCRVISENHPKVKK